MVPVGVTRTAGFNSIAIGACQPSALFVMTILMFIGAAPGSTGGGVKVSTIGVLLAALWATARGSADAVIFKRRLPHEQIARAFLICLVAFLAVNGVAAVLLAREGRELLPTLFEVVSAFGTVGMSTGEGGGPLSLSGRLQRPESSADRADDVCRPHRPADAADGACASR